jgi:hypothetical protein
MNVRTEPRELTAGMRRVCFLCETPDTRELLPPADKWHCASCGGEDFVTVDVPGAPSGVQR